MQKKNTEKIDNIVNTPDRTIITDSEGRTIFIHHSQSSASRFFQSMQKVNDFYINEFLPSVGASPSINMKSL